MMLMKLERMQLQMEKEKQLKKLSDIEGHEIQGAHIPDYIDPKFAKEKNIYDDDDCDDILFILFHKPHHYHYSKQKDYSLVFFIILSFAILFLFFHHIACDLCFYFC